MNYQPSLLLLTMILFSTPMKADNSRDGARPSMAFIEFLGEWETSSGEWIDPENFEDEDFVNLMTLTDDENNRSANQAVDISQSQKNRSASEND